MDFKSIALTTRPQYHGFFRFGRATVAARPTAASPRRRRRKTDAGRARGVHRLDARGVGLARERAALEISVAPLALPLVAHAAVEEDHGLRSRRVPDAASYEPTRRSSLVPSYKCLVSASKKIAAPDEWARARVRLVIYVS